MKPTIVTVSSHRPYQDYYCWDAFFSSAGRFGYQPLVLGQEGQYGGLGTKLRLLKQAIDRGRIETDYIIWSDCFDVVFQDDPAEAVTRHYVHNTDTTWNAERNCFPSTPELIAKHPASESDWRFFNSGFAVGRTEAFQKLLQSVNADAIANDHQENGRMIEPNDQFILMEEFLDQGETTMRLDTECEVCQTLCGVEEKDLDFSGPKITNKATGKTPIGLHINGGVKEFWKPRILHKLGL